MMAYLTMMAVRLVELRRVLKPTGCLYLHCDEVAGHYLKVLMDGVFGPERFQPASPTPSAPRPTRRSPSATSPGGSLPCSCRRTDRLG
jgi:hypothetical protein